MSDFERIDKYVVVGKVGQGSFGVVYKGRDPYLKRPVAIKVCSVDDEGLRRRFLREAEISGKLQHKNIVTVFAFGFEQEVPYLAQEFLSGEDLDKSIKRRAKLSPSQRIGILQQVAGGLAYAHRQGVIHRDIKPSNVRLLEDGRVKIMDFGIAKLANAETQLTQKGVTMGTASYLPPEQVRGGKLDHRADIFSFGVLAYELLTYERPFQGNTLSALVYQILYKVPLPMSSVWEPCPRELSDLVSRCLDKKPDNRFASFDEIIEELEGIHQDLEGGKWPELLAVTSSLPAIDEEESDSADAPMSPEVISHAAETVIAERGLVPQGDLGSTQPVDVVAVAGAAPQTSMSTEDDVENVGSGSLIIEGEAIGSLVAEGRLEEAMQRLEETVILQRDGSDEVSPGSASDAAMKTVILGGEDGTVPAAATVQMKAVEELPPPPPVAAEVKSPSARRAEPEKTSRPTAKPAADGSQADSFLTAIRLSPSLLKWGGAAVGLVAALLLVGRLVTTGGKEAVPEAVPPPPALPVAAALPSSDPALGRVLIKISPWAELTEVTDAEGFVQEMPTDRRTPLSLELPPGDYTLTLRNAGFPDDEVICPVTLEAGSVAECVDQIAEPNVTDYFKQAGWWR